MPTRVLQALEDSVIREKLRHKLPKNVKSPDLKSKYPTLLVKALPRAYFDLGILAESLLRESDVNLTVLEKHVKSLFKITLADNVLKAKSTSLFLDNIITTNNMVKEITNETLQYDKELSLKDCEIIGHPDIITKTHVFEIKTSGKIKDSWTKFLLQTFCYAALAPATVKQVHVVLPLQCHIWSFTLSEWSTRKEFTKLLTDYKAPTEDYSKEGIVMRGMFKIGSHISKKGKLFTTIEKLDSSYPFQLFLSMSTKLNFSDEEIAKTSQIVQYKKLRVYVHAPYVLNLCDTKEYIVDTLINLMNVSHACGFQGVVVHVGKSVKKTEEDALKIMKDNIMNILNNSEGHLILETPAGQGTEVLTTSDSFIDFVVNKVKNSKLKVCVDTCHVFACGTYPQEYLEEVASKCKERLKLIHFNDSQTDFNSRVDRHATIGRGKIPFQFLMKCADIGRKLNIDMLSE